MNDVSRTTRPLVNGRVAIRLWAVAMIPVIVTALFVWFVKRRVGSVLPPKNDYEHNSRAADEARTTSRAAMSPSATTQPREKALEEQADRATVERRHDRAEPLVQHVSIDGDDCLLVTQGDMRRMFHPNGQLLDECPLIAGKPEGLNRSWHKNGVLGSEGIWVNGRREGTWRYFSDRGSLISEGAFLDDHKQGEWHDYHSTGGASFVGSYDRDYLVGHCTFWRADGSIDSKHTGYYRNNERISD